ncbi:MAG: DUF480 domain-containing protein [Gammaproteobacteria bacterium]|nr:DUF480 domain-containing protein [Gammaproteobacteria bacterium]
MSVISPQINARQARVLGCLMEKHLATPANYPLTLNSLVLACNQKTNRAVVMNLTEGEVGHIVGELVELDFARVDYGDRANKISHRAPAVLKITRQQQAVLAMLILREPLTLNDIKARTERMVHFDHAAAVREVVNELISREPALLVKIPKGAGRRENRYTHLLCGAVDIELPVPEKPARQSAVDSDKIAELEARIEELERALGIATDLR